MTVSSRLNRPQPLLAALLALVLAACASAVPTQAPLPAPRPGPTPAPVVAPPPPPPATTPALPADEPPRNWHLLDESADRLPGISAERALREVIGARQPARTVVVAVIDGGVDTAHVDLATNLWSNPKEVAGNGRDDDGNGLVDDGRGWNFIGGGDGRNVHHDTFELTRLHARCTRGAAAGVAPAPPPPATQCQQVAQEYARKKTEAEETLQQVQNIDGMLARAVPLLKQELRTETLTVQNVTGLRSSRPEVQQARQLFLQLAENGITLEEVADAKKAYSSQVQYGYDLSFDPRPIVGDNYADASERRYGNRDVTGPDASHGTHVAGIVGAVRGNKLGVDGIALAVRLMAIRTVPDGDERDKDVANAIRYAVDNGAHIINMSFGKAYSPEKSVVDEAVKHADARGVLLVHAAGNDGEDVAQRPSYPNPFYAAGGRAASWIEVGASSWKGADSLAAPFSNYGRPQVDVFAPGEDILSAEPGGSYGRSSGTSMAAPVVSGLAALIMSYYPALTAADVKRIILESATKYGDRMVVRPGSRNGERVRFGTLSVTGGVVNAVAALRMAEAANRGR